MSNLILPEIKAALAPFIKANNVGEILSLGLKLQKPVLLYGRGGHGKSDMIRAAFKALAQHDDEWGIQSCGEGMTEDKIYGGLDLDALSRPENKVMQFFPERSFLNKKYYAFEELGDAPPVVLLSFKDTITDGRLNNGNQTFEMKTLLLIAATNKSPQEISEMGHTYEALMDRFPLQARVEWDSYGKDDFLELFNRVEKGDVISSNLMALLAQLISDAHDRGQWISPRTAIVCMRLLKASAALHNRNSVTEDDFFAMKFVPGTEQILDDLAYNLDRIKKVARAQELLTACDIDVTEIISRMNQYEQNQKLTNRSQMFLQLSASLEKVEAKLQNISLPDNLVRSKDQLIERIAETNKSTIRLAKQFANS